jgi:hypothetical protein
LQDVFLTHGLSGPQRDEAGGHFFRAHEREMAPLQRVQAASNSLTHCHLQERATGLEPATSSLGS